jgi:pSer/pThr/pTyr-binding forkhead associated (FHA) protein
MATLVFYLDDSSTLTHDLEDQTTTLGRHPDSVVVLDFPSVSARHAVIEQKEDGFYVTDQKSSNGTRVNGAEIEEAKLQDGDRVGFGDVQAVFYEQEAPVVIEVPAPELVVEAPPPLPKANYRPAPVRRKAIRRSQVSGYPDDGGSGCLTAILVVGLFLGAFAAGLYLRHAKETNGNFFNDLFNKIGVKVPQIKIEKSDK